MNSRRAVGNLLREWRQHRHMSQLALAVDAGVSPRHLCFLETGRAQPSREMLLRLAARLHIPLRNQNQLLEAAGFASEFPVRSLGHADLQAAREAIDVLLGAHKPYPAFAVDRYWTLVATNGAFGPFLRDVDEALLSPPINVLRLTLHPRGLAPRLANYEEWRTHVIDKLRLQVDAAADAQLGALLRELASYEAPTQREAQTTHGATLGSHRFVVPFQIVVEGGILSFFSTTTVFGTPVDVTVSELSIESFYPADKFTTDTLQAAMHLPPR